MNRPEVLLSVHPIVVCGIEARDALDVRQSCAVLQLLLPSQSAFVGRTAAEIYGIPFPRAHSGISGQERPLEVSYPHEIPRRTIAGVRHRQWQQDPTPIRDIDGLQVLSPARTWLDLAAGCKLIITLRLVTTSLRAGLASVDELCAVVSWARRRRGVRTARETVALIDPS